MLFEGGEAAVATQVAATQALVGARETNDDIWDEARELPGRGPRPARFPPGELAARLPCRSSRSRSCALGSGVAYTPSNSLLQSPSPALAALHERIRAAFDPHGILSP